MFLSYVGVGSECRPSFFELIAQEKLSKSLLPALSALLSVSLLRICVKFGLKVFLQHFSERLPSLRNVAKRDIEIFYFLSFLLQKRYLGKNSILYYTMLYWILQHFLSSITIVPGRLVLTMNFRRFLFRKLLWSGSTPSYHRLWSFNSLQWYWSLVVTCWVGEKSFISSLLFHRLLLQVLLPYLKSKLDQFHRSHYHLLQVQNSELARELPVCVFSILSTMITESRSLSGFVFFFYEHFCVSILLWLHLSLASISYTSYCLRLNSLPSLIWFIVFSRSRYDEWPCKTWYELYQTLTWRDLILSNAGPVRKESFCNITTIFTFLPIIVFPLAVLRFIYWVFQMGHSHICLCHQVYWLVYFSLSPHLCLNRLARLRESKDRLGAVESLPIPPPPPLPQSFSGTVDNRCPLCSGQITNAACAPSGFVFCYLCLFRHVSRSPFCPITRAPCSTDHIRRLYDE